MKRKKETSDTSKTNISPGMEACNAEINKSFTINNDTCIYFDKKATIEYLTLNESLKAFEDTETTVSTSNGSQINAILDNGKSLVFPSPIKTTYEKPFLFEGSKAILTAAGFGAHIYIETHELIGETPIIDKAI